MYVYKRVRLLPTKEQEQLMFKFAGARRYAWNWSYNISQEYYKINKRTMLSSEIRKEFTKHRRVTPWLNEVPFDVTKQAIIDFCNARSDYFNGKAGKPKLKRKNNAKQIFYNEIEKTEIGEDFVKLTKLKKIKIKEKNYLPIHKFSRANKERKTIGTKIYNPRIIYDGHFWYLSIAYLCESKKPNLNNKIYGIDLGLKTFATLGVLDLTDKKVRSKKYPNKKEEFKKLMMRKKRIDRIITKRDIYYTNNRNLHKSKNYKKLLKKRRKITRKISNIQKNYIRHIVNDLVKSKPKKIIIENLNIRGMMKNKRLAFWISVNQFYYFSKFLEYKCNFYNIEFLKADMFFPSSKQCFKCKHKKKFLSLKERTYVCEHCGFIMDRDKNAAFNLASYK